MPINKKCLSLLLLGASSLLATPVLGQANVEAPPAKAGGNQGFLYGTVTAKSGTVYEGRLRWKGEEAFWGDHFNSSKEEPDFLRDVPNGGRKREPIKVLGFPVGVYSDDWGRQLVARFGDIDRIEIRGGDEATVHLKGGQAVEIDGGSNDIGATVIVWDARQGEIELEWKRLRVIQFKPTPANLQVAAERMYGVVKTTSGEFRGFVQWDQEECLSTDKIDGDGPDGRMAIEMGRIRSIERNSRKSSRLILQDGQDLVLDGTNDVDSDNRGIFVEDERYGRVLISWDEFKRVDFSRMGSGPAYEDFKGSRPLYGKVKTGGRVLDGRIIYDLDEEATWELLNGELDGIEYSIPFSLIRTIIPDRERAEVILRSGEKLVLEDSQDVGEENDGLLVYVPRTNAKGELIDWRDIERIDFE